MSANTDRASDAPPSVSGAHLRFSSDLGVGRRILIVEDDQDFAESILENLRSYGYEVRWARTASGATDVIRDFDAQVVLLDIRLGSASGIDLIPALKQTRPDILCVVVTGYASLDTAIEALRNNVYDYLRKPFHMTELLVTVERCFGTLDLQREKDQAERKLQEAHDLLQEQVRERTLELETANASLKTETERAKAASRAKSVFLSNMSHELRTPLTGILGFADLLLRQEEIGPLNDTQLDYVHNVATSGKRLLDLLNDILDLARVEAGKLPYSPERFSLADLLQGCLEVFRTITAGKVELSLDLGYVGDIVADQQKVRQIVDNLLSNACKFTPHGGRVGIEAVQSEQEIVIAVWDTGIGIAKSDQAKIFEEFEQVEDSFTRRFKGAGLGLALTKRLVNMLDGRIWLESTPGEGSRFSFSLPLGKSASELTADTRTTATQQPASSENASKVLIIEDEHLNRIVVRDTLRIARFQTVEAKDGRSGIEMARSEQPSLILLDIQLPDMNGLEVLESLKQDATTRHIPVVALTAYAMSGDRQRFLDAGCVGYLTKPIDVETFGKQVHGIVTDHDSSRPAGPRVGKILVVDDDEMARKAASFMLRSLGFDVLTADGGAEAIQIFQDHTDEVDLVLLDLMMQPMGGVAVHRELRRIQDDLPVIVVSGHPEDEVATRFASRSYTEFAGKPYQVEDLLDKIQRLLTA